MWTQLRLWAARLSADGATVRVEHLDLADQASVLAFLARWDGPAHLLVNNAGVMATPESRTAEGWELQLATNHLAAEGARVMSVSSAGHLRSDVDLADPNFDFRPYDRWAAYGQSKTANILFAVAAAARWESDGIAVNTSTPGGVRTNLQRHQSPAQLDALYAAFGGIDNIDWKTPAQGAATTVLLGASPLVERTTGKYFEDCQVAATDVPPSATGVAAYATDTAAADELWDLSLRLLRPPAR
jgi:NAD(P)-dependent dehydrogenase (short-subunit alcohol dehydrogenase family)